MSQETPGLVSFGIVAWMDFTFMCASSHFSSFIGYLEKKKRDSHEQSRNEQVRFHEVDGHGEKVKNRLARWLTWADGRIETESDE